MSDNGSQNINQVQIPHMLPSVPEPAQLGTTTVTGPAGRFVLLTVSAPGRTISLMITQDDAKAWGKQLLMAGSGIIVK